MTETMVERVARSLIERIGSPWPYDEMDPMIRRLWDGHARAAIEAMRSPTDEMLHIGDEAVDTCTKVDPCLTPAKHIWADMITAALGEGSQ